MDIAIENSNVILEEKSELLGIESIEDIKTSDNYLENLKKEVAFMEKIDNLRKNDELTENEAKKLMTGLYSVMYEDILKTNYLTTAKTKIDNFSSELVENYGELFEKAIQNKLTSQEYENVILNSGNFILENYLTNNNVTTRTVNSETDLFFKSVNWVGLDFFGLYSSGLVRIDGVTEEEKSELIKQGFEFTTRRDDTFIDFSKKNVISINKINKYQDFYNDIIYVLGTVTHEGGHKNDRDFKSRKNNVEDELISKIFNITSRAMYSGTEAETPEYNLRGTELFQHELGSYMRVKMSQLLNEKKGEIK